jgi:hypothetical protein
MLLWCDKRDPIWAAKSLDASRLERMLYMEAKKIALALAASIALIGCEPAEQAKTARSLTYSRWCRAIARKSWPKNCTLATVGTSCRRFTSGSHSSSTWCASCSRLKAQTTTRHDEIEMELGLPAFVDLPQMQERFGEHLTFTIRALMCKPLGSNLRNQIAHGPADSNLCNSSYEVNAWWLILALVVEHFQTLQQAEQANNRSLAPFGITSRRPLRGLKSHDLTRPLSL